MYYHQKSITSFFNLYPSSIMIRTVIRSIVGIAAVAVSYLAYQYNTELLSVIEWISFGDITSLTNKAKEITENAMSGTMMSWTAELLSWKEAMMSWAIESLSWVVADIKSWATEIMSWANSMVKEMTY